MVQRLREISALAVRATVEIRLEEIGDYIALDIPKRDRYAARPEFGDKGALVLRVRNGARNLPGIFSGY